MKSYALMLFSSLCLLLLASTLTAGEQRVLMSFNNSGHQVRHIVLTQSARSIKSPTKARAESESKSFDIEAMISQLHPGVAVLVWKDDERHSNISTEEPDPRVSHAPAHILSSTESRMGKSDGAWLVVGPDSATSVIILLPADPSLGLAFEQWEVSLVSK